MGASGASPCGKVDLVVPLFSRQMLPNWCHSEVRLVAPCRQDRFLSKSKALSNLFWGGSQLDRHPEDANHPVLRLAYAFSVRRLRPCFPRP